MKRKKIGLILFVFVSFIFSAFILCTCNSRTISEKSFKITKAWWPVWDTFQIGVNQREEAKKSFKTSFIQKEDYVPALEEFQKDGIDAATLTIYEAILAASQGIPLKIVLLLDYSTGSDGLVVKNNIQSLLDLKGKRIGVQEGTIAHFTVLKALEKAGLDKTEVHIKNLDLDSLQQAFLHNEIDAAAIYEPYMSDMARQGNGHILFSSREIPRYICDVLFVKEAVARDHPDVIDHWIECWNDALNFKRKSPDEYFRMLNRLNGTPIPDLKESFNGIFFTNMAENRIAFGNFDRPGYLLESLQKIEKFMLEQGIIKKTLQLKGLIEFEGIQRFFKR